MSAISTCGCSASFGGEFTNCKVGTTIFCRERDERSVRRAGRAPDDSRGCARSRSGEIEDPRGVALGDVRSDGADSPPTRFDPSKIRSSRHFSVFSRKAGSRGDCARIFRRALEAVTKQNTRLKDHTRTFYRVVCEKTRFFGLLEKKRVRSLGIDERSFASRDASYHVCAPCRLHHRHQSSRRSYPQEPQVPPQTPPPQALHRLSPLPSLPLPLPSRDASRSGAGHSP